MNKILIIVVATLMTLNGLAQTTPATSKTPATEAPAAAPTPAPAPKKMAPVNTSGRPSNPIELGISGGLHMIWGDVNSNVKFNLDNSTFGIHARKAITNAYSMRLQYNYGTASMRDNAPRQTAAWNQIGQGFGNNLWFVNSRAYSHMISLDQIWTIGNSNVYKANSKWSLDLFAGPTLVAYRTLLDLRNNNTGGAYNYTAAGNAFTANQDPSISDGGKKALNEAGKVLDNVFDNVYDKEAIHKSRAFGGYSLTPAISFGTSINRLITNKLSASLEFRGVYLFDDYIDGERFAAYSAATTTTNGVTTVNQPILSPQNDFITNTTLKLSYFLGKKGDQPLYWRNSYDEVNRKLAAMNPRKELNAALMDDDADGVPNILDQEAGSKEGYSVDTKGVMVDSDKDGYLDGDDKEPYSPAGYPVDNNGVAKVPPPACCAEIENLKKAAAAPVAAPVTTSPACAEAPLPTVTFDKSKYGINSTMVGALKTIGDKMQACPDMKLVVNGINDKNTNNGKLNEQLSYNRAMEVSTYLSEKYGVSRDRFIIRYNLEGVGDQEADRAVMFRNAQEGESGASNPPSPHPGLKAGNK